jgi:hypothetical protein
VSAYIPTNVCTFYYSHEEMSLTPRIDRSSPSLMAKSSWRPSCSSVVFVLLLMSVFPCPVSVPLPRRKTC